MVAFAIIDNTIVQLEIDYLAHEICIPSKNQSSSLAVFESGFVANHSILYGMPSRTPIRPLPIDSQHFIHSRFAIAR